MELKSSMIEGKAELPMPFNCTLWNWNHVWRIANRDSIQLLIAPYGIEIWKIHPLKRCKKRLLIAPYGIEINKLQIWHLLKKLLIAPYGIEISLSLALPSILTLLIAPYGIEIYSDPNIFKCRSLSFNCTLWNWNYIGIASVWSVNFF